jgi:phosphocarrier protein HPr
MIGLMLLEASAGTRLTIEASGADEVAAVDALARLVGNRFGESAERPS